ncbi:hypothetical protein BDV96DRAFT_187039 [Lophiotrema nucula]|uniref:Uncharacterized protein n=1 Tax=Lophiotrema nucula TaxID=690887 RepID=A0A6A5YVN3_9PLEO|nr:hypothetical protein BDV96DRAFT_187039 [Lophiotrema nucula]
MEPLSIISLAGNVVQFVEFTAKLFNEAQEIFESTDGLSKATREIRSVSESMIECANKAQNLASSGTVTDAQLAKLCTASADVAKQLLSALPAVEGKQVRKGKTTSIRQLLSMMWKKDEVRRLSQRMADLRSQLNTVVMLNLNEQVHEILAKTQSSAQPTSYGYKATVERCFEGELLRKLIDGMRPLRAQITSGNPANQTGNNIFMNKIMEEVGYEMHLAHNAQDHFDQNQASQNPNPVDMTSLIGRVAMLTEEYQNRVDVLRSLWFDRIDVRVTRIPKAHEATFQWILNPESCLESDDEITRASHFLHWLSTESGIFWIAGKPGSGKSTLMKYVWQQYETKECLTAWAQGEEFYLAKFFFWNGGTQIEKSLEGCLRSLLYELLGRSRVSVSSVFESRWKQLQRGLPNPNTWEVSELCSAIKKLIGTTETGPRYCFFIDGLDEFGDDPALVIEVMNELDACPRVKLCLSSRPWNIFEDHFGHDPDRKLYLQDLTWKDIWSYSEDLLYSRMVKARTPNPDQAAANLAEVIARKAEGVFLWVYLAVGTLCKGVTNGDSAAILDARLQEFPSELDSFYRHILRSVEPIYRKQSAATLQVALQTERPLLLMVYSFLFEDDPEYAIKLPHSVMCEEEMGRRLELARRQLNARCYGLLEPVRNTAPNRWNYYDYNVEWLHRTARDFVLHEDIHEVLSVYLDHDFHPSVPLCRALLAQLKTEPKATTPEFLSWIVGSCASLFEGTGLMDVPTLDGVCDAARRVRSLSTSHDVPDSEFYATTIKWGLSIYPLRKMKANSQLNCLYGKMMMNWALEASERGSNLDLIRHLLTQTVIDEDPRLKARALEAISHKKGSDQLAPSRREPSPVPSEDGSRPHWPSTPSIPRWSRGQGSSSSSFASYSRRNQTRNPWC